MRSPSGRCLNQRADYYPAIVGQDPDGAPQFTFSATPSLASVPCSAQPQETNEMVDELGRVTRERRWEVLMGSSIAPGARDRLNVTDRAGVEHLLFVTVDADEAGRGAMYTVQCVEKI